MQTKTYSQRNGAAHKQFMANNKFEAQHPRGVNKPSGQPPAASPGSFVTAEPKPEAPESVSESLVAETSAPTGLRIIAVFQPQKWTGDYASDDATKPTVSFDVTDLVNRMPAAKRRRLRDFSAGAEELQAAAIEAGILEPTSDVGYLTIDESIEAYDEAALGQPTTEAEVPFSYIGRQMDADALTVAAWDEFAARTGVQVDADGSVAHADLQRFESELFGGYYSEYELEEAWDNYRTGYGPSMAESLVTVKTSEGVAAFWA